MDEIRKILELMKNEPDWDNLHLTPADLLPLYNLAERVEACEGLPEKQECTRHQSATDTPQGQEYCVQCIKADYYNHGIDACSPYTEKLRLELEQSKNRERMCGDCSVKRELEFVTLKEQMKDMCVVPTEEELIKIIHHYTAAGYTTEAAKAIRLAFLTKDKESQKEK